MRQSFLLLILMIPASVLGQTTTVTGTIVDPNGNPFGNGTASAFKVVASGQPSIPSVNVTTNASGLFTMTLTSPASYQFTVCAVPLLLGQPTVNPTPKQVCFSNVNPIAISGASQDVSATLNALAPILGPQGQGTNPNFTNINVTGSLTVPAPSNCSNSVSTGIGTTLGANCTNSTGTGAWTVGGNLTVSGNQNNTCIATPGSASSIQTCINNYPNGGGQIFIPAGTYSSTSCPVLTIGGTSPNIQNGMELYGAGSFGSTIIQYTGGTVCAQVILVQNSVPATNLVFDLVMRDFEVRSTGNAQNGIKLNEVHHSTLQDILCRDVSVTCLVWYGGVGNNIIHWKTTNSGVTYSTFPQHCMDLSTSLGSSGNGFTSTHIIAPVCEFVTGTGILMSNAQFNVLSGAQISTNGASLDLENGTATSNSNQFEGNLYEVTAAGVDNVIVAACCNVFVNSSLGVASTKFHLKAGGYNNRIENGIVGSVTIDAGVLNTHLTQINTDPANIVDNGTNTQISNDFGVTNHKQWFFTQPTMRQVVPGVQPADGLVGGAGYDPQDHPVQGCWDFGASAVTISQTPLTTGKPWRAIFIGTWEQAGGAPAQQPELVEITSGAATYTLVGGTSATATFSVSAGGLFQGIRGSTNNVSFCGTIYVQPSPNNAVGTNSEQFAGNVTVNHPSAGPSFTSTTVSQGLDFSVQNGNSMRVSVGAGASYFLDLGTVTLRDGNAAHSGSLYTANFGFDQAGTNRLTNTATAPTIAAAGCGGAAAAIVSPNGTAAFKINVGTTPTSACTFTMPAATTGWNVTCNDITTQSTAVFVQKQTGAESTTSVTITNFNDVAAATAFVAGDILKCTAAAD